MSDVLELVRSRRKTVFDAAPPRVQKKMFLGCGDLAGQRSLFDADVFDATVDASTVERVFRENPGCGAIVYVERDREAVIYRDSPLAADWHGIDRRAEILRELVLRGVRVAIVERV